MAQKLDSQRGKPGVYIKTYGCQMNAYDTAKLHKVLESQYSCVDTVEAAQLVIVNTCSVRDKPEQKLYSLLGELRELKQLRPDLIIGVGGCVAQQEGRRIIARNEAVDFVFGTHNLSLVPGLIEQRLGGAPPPVAIDYRDEWEDLPAGFVAIDRVSVFVSISRGCNKNCTYCIVPTTRGREVSRAPSEIEREVRIAVVRGAKEVTLLGQTVNSYGLDLEPRLSFAALISRLSEIAGLERIRFISPHPQDVKPEFIDLLVNNPKVCRHIHLPLQSGSDRILKLMNRNYRRKRYLEIVEALRQAAPDVAITTDIIVGFPGETTADFEQTLEVMEAVQYDDSYSYVFSPRPGTVAAGMPEELSPAEKLIRLKTLQAKQFDITQRRLASWYGKTVEVLVEGPSSGDSRRLCGRTSHNTLLNFEQEEGDLRPGMICSAIVTGSARFTLKGRAQIRPPGIEMFSVSV